MCNGLFSYECVKEELEEFQTSSHELEFELESQLTRAENKNKELTVTNSKLQTEVENLKASTLLCFIIR